MYYSLDLPWTAQYYNALIAPPLDDSMMLAGIDEHLERMSAPMETDNGDRTFSHLIMS